jgi:very-short-patch-repair endonuclease
MECDFETDNGKIMSNHVRWKHRMTVEKREELSKKLSAVAIKTNTRINGTYIISVTKICSNKKCGKEFVTRQRVSVKTKEIIHWKGKTTYFECDHCSVSCGCLNGAHADRNYFWTKERRDTQSKKSKELWKNDKFIRKMEMSACNKLFTSKREIEIRNYFLNTFPGDGWTFGKIAEYKNEIINPDLWSRKLKIIFEYDGVWHFKDIHGQLERKKIKDKLTEEYAINNGFRLIRIDEDEKLDLEYIQNLIYNFRNNIIKIGKRY